MAARLLERETTVARAVSYRGRGLHTGRPSRVTIRPAPAGTGIVFARCDLPRRHMIPARIDFVGTSRRATGLSCDGVGVLTVEHILAAVLWVGVDNALIEVEGEEVPLGDGSSRTFVELVEEAGIVELERERRALRVRTPVWVTRDEACAIALPVEDDVLRVSFTFVAAKPGMRSFSPSVMAGPYRDGGPIAVRRCGSYAATSRSCSELGVLPLPNGERGGVRGKRSIERP